MQSVTGKILNLPEKTILLSGHTEPTTVGAMETVMVCTIFVMILGRKIE